MKKKVISLVIGTAVVIAGCGSDPEPVMVEVPDVVGLTEGDAQGALINAHLYIEWQPEEVGESSVGVEEWLALSQTPGPGTQVEEFSEVTVQFEALEPEQPSKPVETLAKRVEDAFSETYGWPDDPHWEAIESFHMEGESRVGVVSSLFPKDENEEEAMKLCRAVSSIGRTVDDENFKKVHVTAGEGGKWLAECEVPFTNN